MGNLVECITLYSFCAPREVEELGLRIEAAFAHACMDMAKNERFILSFLSTAPCIKSCVPSIALSRPIPFRLAEAATVLTHLTKRPLLRAAQQHDTTQPPVCTGRVVCQKHKPTFNRTVCIFK